MVQSSLLDVLRDMPEENRNLLKEQCLASSKNNSQVEVHLCNNQDVISRSFPFENGRNLLTQIEEQASIIFLPYLPKPQVTKLKVFYIDDGQGEHALDTEETLQSLLNTRSQSEHKAVSFKLEVVQDDVNVDKLDIANVPDELGEFECSICGELGDRDFFFKCLHCNFSHVCCNCRLTANQHENHLTAPPCFFFAMSKDERISQVSTDEVKLETTSM